MPFIRIVLLIVAVLAVAVIGLAVFRPDADLSPSQAVPAPASAPQPVVIAPPRPANEVMSPADASSPADITAREAAEAQQRLEKEQQDAPMMMAPGEPPVNMMPPNEPPPVKE